MLCLEGNSVKKSKIIMSEKIQKSISSSVSKTINDGKIILSKCAVCNTKKSRFIKKREPKGLLSNLGIRTLLSKF